jgi:hypothetical protein
MEFERFMIGTLAYTAKKKVAADVKKYPELKSDFSYYDMTRVEKQEAWLTRYNHLKRIDKDFYFNKALDNGTFYYFA